MAALLGLFSACMLATIGVAVAFLLLRFSPFRGGIPAQSLAALYAMLVLGIWALVGAARPPGRFLGLTYWFPLAGISVLAALFWLYGVLRVRQRRLEAGMRIQILPMSVRAYWAVAALLAGLVVASLLLR